MTTFIAQLQKYTPRLVLEHIAKHPEKPKAPYAQNIVAGTLFADMAGFTSLTEKIMKISPNGLIELADIINLFLGRQINIIDQYGGDILKFAGDAIIAVWPANSTAELEQAALQVAHCGIELQRQLDRTKIGSGLELSLRIGIGAGPLLAQMVGGLYDRWEFLIGGDAIDQVGRAQKYCEPGQVVISPEAAHILRKAKTALRTGNRLWVKKQTTESLPIAAMPYLPQEAGPALSCFIPRRIINLIEEGAGPTPFEVRTVTVLFIRILEWQTASLPIDSVHKVMRQVQDGLYRNEGAINRFGIEEKGTVILAAFGLPPLDHNDDALRALRSARDIVHELSQMGHQSVIGIGTGVVFVGPMGNEIRSEYTMHGNIVNLAARLMQASDYILCDEETHNRVVQLANEQPQLQDEMQFEPLPPLKVKGRTEPVQAYRLINPNETPTSQS